MSYFKVKMHQIRGLLLREGREGEGKGGQGKGREGKGEGPPGSCLHPPDVESWIKPCPGAADEGRKTASPRQ